MKRRWKIFWIVCAVLAAAGLILTAAGIILGAPVRGAILTGNGPEALRNISALGNNLVMDPGMCGKSGQSVPVTDGQPSMLIEGLTVGGSEA